MLNKTTALIIFFSFLIITEVIFALQYWQELNQEFSVAQFSFDSLINKDSSE